MATTTETSTAAVAHELVDLCRAGRNMDAVNRLYATNIVSVEPAGTKDMPAEMKGIDAIRGKNQWWYDNNELHGSEVRGPFLGEDQFAVQYMWDTTFKPTGQRATMAELALYTVKDGKIVREQFFYNMGSPQE
jgi:hypothetical protein